MHRSLRRRFALLLPLALLAACDAGAEQEQQAAAAPPPRFGSAELCVVTDTDTLRVPVELAETDRQRAYGLMERDVLAADAGMLFTYEQPQPAESGYWMFRTRIPLDIAYITPEGTIGAIVPMEPCASPNPQFCPTYPAGVVFQSALEMNRGWFAARGVEPGDRVLRAGEPGCPAGQTARNAREPRGGTA